MGPRWMFGLTVCPRSEKVEDTCCIIWAIYCHLGKCLLKVGWSEKGLNIFGRYLNLLQKVGDINILAKSQQELQEILEELNKNKKVGPKMNLAKAKAMFKEENDIKLENK